MINHDDDGERRKGSIILILFGYFILLIGQWNAFSIDIEQIHSTKFMELQGQGNALKA